MEKLSYKILFLLFLIFTLFSTPSISWGNNNINEALQSNDYEKAAKLLEKQIDEIKNINIKDFDEVKRIDLYRSYFVLADIYAWRLNEKDKALAKLKEFSALKTKIDLHEMSSIENLYMAEIYEKKNDIQKSRENYEYILWQLNAKQENNSKSDEYVMNEELIKFISFKLDGLNLKDTKTKKQLLKKLKLTSICMHHSCWMYMVGFFVPKYASEWNVFYFKSQKLSLSDYIRQSNDDFGTMMFNIFLILEAKDKSIDEANKAFEVFVDKYPDNYFTISLINLFYKNYIKNNQQSKALKLKSILENIGKQHQMEIITEPDKRFSSPQKTWELHQSALLSGNINLALECFFPAKRREKKETYMSLGMDVLKQDAREPSELLEQSRDEFRASYNVNRKNWKDGMSSYVTFINSDGEWLIE
jgi:tetratricopeptide (TPR) repeat protein